MSERRFDFYERDSSGKSIYACTITEAELLHRLYLIRTLIETGQSLCQLNERGIDILLHGEKEQPERKKGHSRLVYDKATRTINKESGEQTCLSISEDLPKEQDLQKFDGIPAKNQAEIHKKQPGEWEEWLSRCPSMYLREWFTDMVQILRRKP